MGLRQDQVRKNAGTETTVKREHKMTDDKRRLYKEPHEDDALNEDGTKKTLQQKVDDLNNFIKTAIEEMEVDNEDL